MQQRRSPTFSMAGLLAQVYYNTHDSVLMVKKTSPILLFSLPKITAFTSETT
jgi:hypothetical protein